MACFDKHPLAVIRAQQVADVIAGVNFARDAGLELAVRGGGHSAPGFKRAYDPGNLFHLNQNIPPAS